MHVFRFIVGRLLFAIPLLLGVTLITFLLVRAGAGTFIPGLENTSGLTPADLDEIRRDLGLDRPFTEQYWNWLLGVVHGDFGRSLVDRGPVIGLILERLPNTLLLTLTAMVTGMLISVPLGVLAALRRGTTVDKVVMFLSVAGVSVPSFWMGLLAITLLSVLFTQWGLPALPSGGATSAFGGGDLPDRVAHLIMPVAVLALYYVAIWSQYVRSSMLETLSEDFIRTARSKGLTERSVVYVHALRNSLAPVITLLGLQLPTLLSGAVVVEAVFSWPGIGRLAVERALQFDHTVVLGLTTFGAILVVFGNLVADITYAAIDPRVRYSK
jgi:peptide/nickel transport system permease protein